MDEQCYARQFFFNLTFILKWHCLFFCVNLFCVIVISRSLVIKMLLWIQRLSLVVYRTYTIYFCIILYLFISVYYSCSYYLNLTLYGYYFNFQGVRSIDAACRLNDEWQKETYRVIDFSRFIFIHCALHIVVSSHIMLNLLYSSRVNIIKLISSTSLIKIQDLISY